MSDAFSLNTNSNDGNGTLQFIRQAKLLIGPPASTATPTQGFSAAGLRFAFEVERATVSEPNRLHLKIYNVAPDQIRAIQNEYRRVVLSAGYNGNSALIFDGEIIYTMRGNMAGERSGYSPENFAIFGNRESPTDTVLEITAADGQSAYNYAIVSKTLAAGASSMDIINAIAPAFAKYGVTIGHIPSNLPTHLFARGMVLHGAVKDILDTLCASIRAQWSIQDMKLQIVFNDSYIPGKTTVINKDTGMVGMPRQELNGGVSFSCLLNPYIRMNSVVRLNKGDIQQVAPPTAYNQIDTTQQIDGLGLYRAIRVGHSGDTRGQNWYTSVVAIGINEAGPTAASGLLQNIPSG